MKNYFILFVLLISSAACAMDKQETSPRAYVGNSKSISNKLHPDKKIEGARDYSKDDSHFGPDFNYPFDGFTFDKVIALLSQDN